MLDYSKYYNLEAYLFDEVGPRFRTKKQLDLIDFYFILNWKANRAKGYALRRLAKKAKAQTAGAAVQEIGRALAAATDARERLRILMQDWGFRLATATAILTVLYPEEFTVYDVRVCEALDSNSRRWHRLADESFSDAVWNEYLAFKAAVDRAAPAHLSLRDKDRFLWGQSFYWDACDVLGIGAGRDAAGGK